MLWQGAEGADVRAVAGADVGALGKKLEGAEWPEAKKSASGIPLATRQICTAPPCAHYFPTTILLAGGPSDPCIMPILQSIYNGCDIEKGLSHGRLIDNCEISC